MSKWYDLYVKRLNSDYRSYMSKRYGEFLWKISSRINSHGLYGEFGCGAGNITRLLLEQSGVEHSTFVLLDIDEQMLDLAKKNLGELQTNNNILIGHGNILYGSTVEFDTIYSHGVLEHFSDADINRIINNQKKVCNTLIHYVPSDKYPTQSYGDERLLSVSQWKEICNPTEIKTFNNGYDLMLIWNK